MNDSSYAFWSRTIGEALAFTAISMIPRSRVPVRVRLLNYAMLSVAYNGVRTLVVGSGDRASIASGAFAGGLVGAALAAGYRLPLTACIRAALLGGAFGVVESWTLTTGAESVRRYLRDHRRIEDNDLQPQRMGWWPIGRRRSDS